VRRCFPPNQPNLPVLPEVGFPNSSLLKVARSLLSAGFGLAVAATSPCGFVSWSVTPPALS